MKLKRIVCDMQRNAAFRDDTTEAELSAQIGLLQYEVDYPSF